MVEQGFECVFVHLTEDDDVLGIDLLILNQHRIGKANCMCCKPYLIPLVRDLVVSQCVDRQMFAVDLGVDRLRTPELIRSGVVGGDGGGGGCCFLGPFSIDDCLDLSIGESSFSQALPHRVFDLGFFGLLVGFFLCFLVFLFL